jgi:hypothetical protein
MSAGVVGDLPRKTGLLMATAHIVVGLDVVL